MTREEYLEKIEKVISGKADANLPDVAPIIAMFAERFMPIVPPRASGNNMTSFEIVQHLEDTCSLTTKEVAVVMSYLGFRLFVNDYKGHEWAMQPISTD